jgi:hypothetical protein
MVWNKPKLRQGDPCGFSGMGFALCAIVGTSLPRTWVAPTLIGRCRWLDQFYPRQKIHPKLRRVKDRNLAFAFGLASAVAVANQGDTS